MLRRMFHQAPVAVKQPGAWTIPDRWSFRLAWLALLLLLLAGLPLFVCMPLYADVTTFDLGARNLLRGGVHYRDAFDNGLPGMVWLHVVIRMLLGWRSEAIRLVDFGIVALSVGLLAIWLKPLGVTPAGRAWTAVVLFGFYFATPEVCHCQRDIWMLLPALVALFLRRRQVMALLEGPGPRRAVAARALAEGFCWGLAVWLKPFVMIPGLVCWLLTAILIWRTRAPARRLIWLDAAGLWLGGLLAGVPGLAWLWWSGSWPYFWDILLRWNAEYYDQATNGVFARTTFLVQLFGPWGWVHVAAVLLAVVVIGKALAAATAQTAPPAGLVQEMLLAGLYLGWLVQANYIQWGFLYQLAPTFLLALTVIAGRRWLPGPTLLGWVILGGFLTLAAIRHPLADWQRTAQWTRCWREGSSAALQNQLALTTEPRRPDWVALERVAAFLKEQGVGDRELTCYSYGTAPLYLRLDIEPSTRFVSTIEDVIYPYPWKRDAIRAELAASPQRFVVSDVQFLTADLRGAGLLEEGPATGTERPLVLAPDFARRVRGRYPWSEPIIFRAGPYLVHRSTGVLRR